MTNNEQRDHPRACGEHLCQMFPLSRWLGSSPRLRGTLEHLVDHVAHRGIIPALAGNTLVTCWMRRAAWDHPRACGEHQLLCRLPRVGEGSSPRLRGTPGDWRNAFYGTGIIPALAGNTDEPHQAHGWTRDHPRACGEHQKKEYGTGKPMGSSPRLRGTLHGLCAVPDGGGIIPALAGNTALCLALDKHHRDHPRACGEH